MKKTFNIYGERNSGTNFLYKLISNNFNLEGSMDKKHSLIKEYNQSKNHINFCIVRNLNDWLSSTYKNPYHIDNKYLNRGPRKDIYTFINEKIKNNLNDPCPYDINLSGKYNLVEVRYLKYNSYKNITNKVLVNLDFLQFSDENKQQFLDFVSKKYHLERQNFNPIKKYTGGQGEKWFRTKEFYILKYPQMDFTKLKDYSKEIEEEINSLKFK